LPACDNVYIIRHNKYLHILARLCCVFDDGIERRREGTPNHCIRTRSYASQRADRPRELMTSEGAQTRASQLRRPGKFPSPLCRFRRTSWGPQAGLQTEFLRRSTHLPPYPGDGFGGSMCASTHTRP
jgi:hypothetical protein